MTKEQLNILQKKLTSAWHKAPLGSVRTKIGVNESEQGWSSLNALPVYNPIQDKETTLAEFMMDVNELKLRFDAIQNDYEYLKNQMKEQVEEFRERDDEMKIKLKEVMDRLTDLEAIQTE